MIDAESRKGLEESAPPRRSVATNIVWNWAGMAVDIVAGFVVAPFLVRRLGTTGYGLWIVIGSLSGYFSLLDFGLRGSVGRELAVLRARADWGGANRLLTSAVAIFCALAVAALAATIVAVLVFHRVFDVPSHLLADARLAMLLVGINLALSFPLQVFDGNLWAAQRFDLLNAIDIPATLARVALTFAFVRGEADIVALGIITLGITVFSGAGKALLSYRLDRFLKFRPRYVSKEAAHALFTYGKWNFVLTVARMTKTQLSPIMIGSILGVALVTPFSIARRLQDYAHRVLWTATGVLVPVATALHARSESAQQQRLFVEGGKYSAITAVFFVGYFACLGESVITLWMSPRFADASLLLIVISAGEFFQMTQSLTGSIILATARHKTLAWLSVFETLISGVLVVLWARPFGLLGICVAIAIPQALLSGVATLIYGCRITHVSLQAYLRGAIGPAVLASAGPLLVLALLTMWRSPAGWLMLIAYSAMYTVLYVAAVLTILRPPFAMQRFPAVAAFLSRTPPVDATCE